MSETSTVGGFPDIGQNALTVVPISSRPSAIVRTVTAPAQASSPLANLAADNLVALLEDPGTGQHQRAVRGEAEPPGQVPGRAPGISEQPRGRRAVALA